MRPGRSAVCRCRSYRDVVVDAHAPAAHIHQPVERGQLAADGRLLGRVLAARAEVIDRDRPQPCASTATSPSVTTRTGLIRTSPSETTRTGHHRQKQHIQDITVRNNTYRTSPSDTTRTEHHRQKQHVQDITVRNNTYRTSPSETTRTGHHRQ